MPFKVLTNTLLKAY